MEIAVLIKQVPDTWSERRLTEPEWTLDRESADAVIDEIDTRGVETALQLTEAHGGEVTVVTMGPQRATDALRKALAMGAHKAVHVLDDQLAGSDALQTSAALAAAVRTLSVDLVITGNESTDGRTGALPSMLAERLGLPQVTSVRTIEVDGSDLRAERVHDTGYSEVTAPLPAARVDHREDQRAALPQLQGDHGREEEAGDGALARRSRHRSRDGGPGQRGDDGRRRRAPARSLRRPEGHGRRFGRDAGRRVPGHQPADLTLRFALPATFR